MRARLRHTGTARAGHGLAPAAAGRGAGVRLPSHYPLGIGLIGMTSNSEALAVFVNAAAQLEPGG
jgi:hypothetical protein